MATHATLTRRTPCCRITGGPARPPPRPRGIRCKLKMYPSAVVTCTQPIRHPTRSNGMACLHAQDFLSRRDRERICHKAHAQT
jgi:hypothetical protein